MARDLRRVSLPVDWAGPSHLYNPNDSCPCYHPDVFPDAQGECTVCLEPGWALDEILPGVGQWEKGQLSEASWSQPLYHLSKEAELYTEHN